MAVSGSNSRLSLIDDLCGEVYGALPQKSLMHAYQEANFGDRVYGYQECVFDACSRVFRSRMGEVYYFDGRVWRLLSDIVLENALSKALVRRGVPKHDVVNCRGKLLHSARGGALLSPLECRPTVAAFSNGVWDFGDIDNPVHHPFADRMPVTDVLPYDYDPQAVCPRWDAFLSSVLPKVEIVKLQKYLGLGCADRRSLTHKVEETLWLVGGGANGKSTVFDVVRHVYGADNISYLGLDSLLSGSSEVRARFIGSIAGKLFNYCSEVQADDISRYSDTFKSLCSGEPQTIRRLGHNPETAYDIPFLVFNMNRKPANRNMDRAIVRRLLFVPFRTTISAEDMNRELGNELLEELPGIRNWMIEGFRMLVRDGFRFGDTLAVDEDMEEYMLENGQSVQVFLARRGYGCNRRTGHWDDKPQWVSASALYGDYASFCSRMLVDALPQQSFGREMARLGWNEAGHNRKRTSQGHVYGVFCAEKIKYALEV